MERQKMKKKGFTLVELLVVIAIIAMLLAILMPALGKVRQLAQRIMCSTNLSGVGKAMLTYSNEDKYESFPIAGSPGAYWDYGTTTGCAGVCSFDWWDPRALAIIDTGTDKKVTLSACLYLTVKYADVSPGQFICPGSDLKKFELGKYTLPTTPTIGLPDVWDMGSKAKELVATPGIRGKGHNCYSYQLPLKTKDQTTIGVFPISPTSNPSKAVLADRSPYWQAPMGTAALYVWDSTNTKINANVDLIAAGNATYHQKDGQNILFVDQHAKFERSANCGVESDNIYTVWGQPTLSTSDTDQCLRQCGLGQTAGTTTAYKPSASEIQGATWCPQNNDDNYLVSDVDQDAP